MDIPEAGKRRLARADQTHREYLYRQTYHMGRHVIGYEVQHVLAAIDWLKQVGGSDASIGVAGYGEGGLIAFYAAAVDSRIEATLLSGYFESRENTWTEPIYRNVWSVLDQFGDAELAIRCSWSSAGITIMWRMTIGWCTNMPRFDAYTACWESLIEQRSNFFKGATACDRKEPLISCASIYNGRNRIQARVLEGSTFRILPSLFETTAIGRYRFPVGLRQF